MLGKLARFGCGPLVYSCFLEVALVPNFPPSMGWQIPTPIKASVWLLMALEGLWMFLNSYGTVPPVNPSSCTAWGTWFCKLVVSCKCRALWKAKSTICRLANFLVAILFCIFAN